MEGVLQFREEACMSHCSCPPTPFQGAGQFRSNRFQLPRLPSNRCATAITRPTGRLSNRQWPPLPVLWEQLSSLSPLNRIPRGRSREWVSRLSFAGGGGRYSPLARHPPAKKKGSIDGAPKFPRRLTPGPRR